LGLLLGFFAMAVQALLPLLVAVEIGIIGRAEAAPRGELAGAVTLCGGGGADRSSGHAPRGVADGCPICIAVAAGQGFTVPVMASVAMPDRAGFASFEEALRGGAEPVAATAYDSRAPPLAL
jgi:hypothetical protein